MAPENQQNNLSEVRKDSGDVVIAMNTSRTPGRAACRQKFTSGYPPFKPGGVSAMMEVLSQALTVQDVVWSVAPRPLAEEPYFMSEVGGLLISLGSLGD